MELRDCEESVEDIPVSIQKINIIIHQIQECLTALFPVYKSSQEITEKLQRN